MSEPQGSRRGSRGRYKGRKNSRSGKKGELKDMLDNMTNENVELQKVLNLMEDEEKEAERNESVLLQEVQALKDTIANFQEEKEREENSLKTIIKQLKAELYDLELAKRQANENLHALHENPARDRYVTTGGYPRKQRAQEMKHPPLMDSASVAGVPIYDRKIHKKGRSRKGGQDNGGRLRRSSAQRPRRPSSDRRRDDRGVKNRRMSRPVPHNQAGDGIDAAAGAFLDIFSNLKPKRMYSLWSNVQELTKINDELVLDVRHLPKLLHTCVVFAYRQDNPDKLPPSFRRTKPLINVLKLRLAPNVRNMKYLTLDDFQQFPLWLEQRRDELGTMKPPKNFSSKNYSSPAYEDVRSSLKAGSACLVWSDGGKCWCEGQVTSTKFDKEGEWLVVRYYNNSKSLEKEVQRYSDLIRVLAE